MTFRAGSFDRTSPLWTGLIRDDGRPAYQCTHGDHRDTTEARACASRALTLVAEAEARGTHLPTGWQTYRKSVPVVDALVAEARLARMQQLRIERDRLRVSLEALASAWEDQAASREQDSLRHGHLAQGLRAAAEAATLDSAARMLREAIAHGGAG